MDSLFVPNELWRQRLLEKITDLGTSMDEVSSKAGFEAQYLRSVIEDGLEPPMDKLSVICSELGMSVPELFAD